MAVKVGHGRWWQKVTNGRVHTATEAGRLALVAPADPEKLAPFGVRLREAIERSPKVKNRTALLHLLRVDGKTLYRYEKGERSPNLDLVTRIADALGVPVSELMDRQTAVRVEEERRGWLQFVEKGYVQFFQLRGATPEMVERVRTRRFKGVPTLEDFVAAMEAALEEVEGEIPEALREARRRNVEAGRPELDDMVKGPPKDR